MRIVYFTHSLRSSWNHGNAHFQRGLLRELGMMGHDALACEPEDNWSIRNLRADHASEGGDDCRDAYPDLSVEAYAGPQDLDGLLDGADLVVVHEWNEPWLVRRIGDRRIRGGRFQLFFHDTHHRAVSDPDAIRRFDLSGYDGVLAFGETLSNVYRAWGWGDRVFTWHEAADIRLFRPPEEQGERSGLVWIGNFGDGERAAELEEYLMRPASEAGLPLEVFGVRYPPEALGLLERYGARYRGYLPNASVPDVYARRLATIHVPRRFYADNLPGIPTIRVFEALACGIPLVCSRWRDAENLFRPGDDYLVAGSGPAVKAHLQALMMDAELRASLAASGLERVHSRHTCAHRAQELLAICRRVAGQMPRLEVAS